MTSLTRTTQVAMRKSNRISCFVIVFVVIVLPLTGCLGYLFLGNNRNCWFPPAGENAQILVSACEQPRLFSISPDGRYVLYSLVRQETNRYERRILDLQTGQTQTAPDCGAIWLDAKTLVGYKSDEHNLVLSAKVCDVQGKSETSLQNAPFLDNTFSISPEGNYVFNPQGNMHRDENNQ